ncbi:hypothetical protein CYMTET_45361 [Cymbomonas tetramitiformis]|uniref:Pectate lyase C n=1 Tax=Cymbomonas tetramitiformis TaxID=36881 RepID=A0AAE0C0G4_9CHLO|nr:hypothetical protein CYMTET_45361 [Cymbomonas tetramitiformis]
MLVMLFILWILAAPRAYAAPRSAEVFGVMPQFSDADVDKSGCLSPYEYEVVSQSVQRKALLKLRKLASTFWRKQRRNYQSSALEIGAPKSLIQVFPSTNSTTQMMHTKNSAHRPEAQLISQSLSSHNRRGKEASPRIPGTLALAEQDAGVSVHGVSSSRSVAPAPRVPLGTIALREETIHLRIDSRELVDTQPEECPWLTPTTEDNVLLCNDGTLCDASVHADNWACCNSHGRRAACAKNWPNMCAQNSLCEGGSDHACEKDCSLFGGNRPCYLGCSDLPGVDPVLSPCWQDLEGDTCTDYQLLGYCEVTGEYGATWAQEKGGSFADFVSEGFTAAEACCACGGGEYAPPPSPPSPPISPPVPLSPPPIPPAPPLSTNGEAVVISDERYALTHLEGALLDAGVAAIYLRTDVVLTADLPQLGRALNVTGRCYTFEGFFSRCQLNGDGAHRIFSLVEGAVLHLAALELREAYVDDFGASLLVVGARVSLFDCVIAGSRTLGYGAAVAVIHGHATLDRCQLMDSTGDTGAAVYLYNGSAAVMTATVVEGHSSRRCGSGYILRSSLLVLEGGSQVLRSEATEYGGGLCAIAQSTVRLGGGSVVAECTAQSTGGAVYLDDDSMAALSGGSSLRGNRAEGSGGAVDLRDGANRLEMMDSSIEDNHATNRGGGVNIENGVMVTKGGSSLRGNAAQYGGAVFFGDASSHELVNVTMSGNRADDSGGALYIAAARGHVALAGLSLLNNSAVSMGGAVFTEGTVELTRGTRAEGNFAGLYGGAIYGGQSSTVHVSASTLAFNSAASRGGGMEIGARGSVLLTNGSAVMYNVVSKMGGGLFAGQGASFVLADSSVSHNMVRPDGDNDNKALGAGILLSDHASARIVACLVSNNTFAGIALVGKGGGIYVESGGTVQLEAGLVLLNAAKTGGGISLNDDAFLSLAAASVVRLCRAENGGGVYSKYATVVVRGGCVVTGNTAEISGGGVWANNLTVHGSEVSNNTAFQDGGAGYPRTYNPTTRPA